MSNPCYPVRTLNGSSMRQLAEDLNAVVKNLDEAIENMAKVAPHMRDYIHSREVYLTARDLHMQQLLSIKAVRDALQEKAIHCFGQAK